MTQAIISKRARGAHAMCVHRLGRGDRERVRVRAEHAPDRRRLDLVVGLGAGAVRVEVVDILRMEPGIGEAVAHRRFRPFHGRRDDVGCVGGQARAGDFGQDGGAARHGVLVAFQHRHAGAFAEDQAVAIGRERPACVRRQHAQRLPALQHAPDQRRIGAAGDHDVGAAEPDLVDRRAIAWLDDEQAEVTPNTGPRRPRCMLTWPEARPA